ncbi:MAG: restriction endonuclease subunit S [Treponema sp.]|nr:restriction endonuclease subunit S [Treponema sp.]
METTTYKLKDVLKIGNGKDHSSLPDGEYPVLGSGGIMRYANRYLYDGESVLLPRKGTLNNIQYIKGKFWTVDTCYYTIINQDITHPYYLYRLLRTFDLSGLDSGASIPSMTSKTYYGIKVQLPPLPTQQKIASILSAYDNLIQNYKKQIEALQTAASELYKEWFVRFRFPGWQNAKFENGIPEGWKVEKLGTLAHISTGKCNREDAEDDGIYPLFDRSQEIKKSNEWIKDCEAIIVPGEGTSFIPRYYKGKFNLHQRCYCVEPKYPDFGKFLFYVLMLNRKYFLSVATGATVPSLRYNNFASMKFILPEISLCNNFNKIANDIFAKVDNLQQQITNLTQQRDLLLPRLMSGKLEV